MPPFSSVSSLRQLIGFVLLGLVSSDPSVQSSSLLTLWDNIALLIGQSTTNLLIMDSTITPTTTTMKRRIISDTTVNSSTLELLTIADGSNLIPFPKDDKRLLRAPKDSALSPHYGLHKATLIQKTTVVPEIPGKICPVTTFTFRLDGHPDTRMSDHVQIDLGQTIKLYLEDRATTDGSLRNWTLKSYSPTDVSRPGEIDFTIKLYPDGQNAKMLRALQVGIDHVYLAGPWKVKKRLPASHAYLIAFGIGITDVYQVAKSLVAEGVPTTLLYTNRYRDDTCYREELEEMMMNNNSLFQVKYMYSRETTKGLSSNEYLGRLDSAQTIQEVLGLEQNVHGSEEEPSSSTTTPPIRLLAIGSKPMMKQTWKNLEELGYDRDVHELLQVVG